MFQLILGRMIDYNHAKLLFNLTHNKYELCEKKIILLNYAILPYQVNPRITLSAFIRLLIKKV